MTVAPTTRAAVYCRISQDRANPVAGVQGLGVQRQEDDCRALATSLGWDVATVYVDNDTSAYSGKRRKGYEAMLEALRAGTVDGVLAWHPDRLHRSPRDLEDYLDVCEPRAVITHTVQAGRWDLSTPTGRAVARTVGAWARYESEHKGERVRRARQQQAEAGAFHGGRRPYGYGRDGITLEPTEAAEVARITDAILAGASLRSLVRELNTRGVPTASGRGAWNSQALRDILLRARNAGLRAHHGEVQGPAQWPAIVPEESWRAVVAVLTDPARRTTPGGTVKWIGSGMYCCGVCGQPQLRVSTSGQGRGPAYRCAGREVGETTGHVVRDAATLDDYVERVLVARLSRPDALALLTPARPGVDVAALRAERLAVEQRLDDLAGLFASDTVTARQFGTATEALRARLTALEASLTLAGTGDPLAGLAGAQDVAAVWFGEGPKRVGGLSLGRRRAVLEALADVTVLPTGRGRRRDGSYFTADHIRISWKGTP